MKPKRLTSRANLRDAILVYYAITFQQCIEYSCPYCRFKRSQPRNRASVALRTDEVNPSISELASASRATLTFIVCEAASIGYSAGFSLRSSAGKSQRTTVLLKILYGSLRENRPDIHRNCGINKRSHRLFDLPGF